MIHDNPIRIALVASCFLIAGLIGIYFIQGRLFEPISVQDMLVFVTFFAVLFNTLETRELRIINSQVIDSQRKEQEIKYRAYLGIGLPIVDGPLLRFPVTNGGITPARSVKIECYQMNIETQERKDTIITAGELDILPRDQFPFSINLAGESFKLFCDKLREDTKKFLFFEIEYSLYTGERVKYEAQFFCPRGDRPILATYSSAETKTTPT